jgi:hypothetical protein
VNVHEELFNLCMEAKAVNMAIGSGQHAQLAQIFTASLERLSRELVAWEDLKRAVPDMAPAVRQVTRADGTLVQGELWDAVVDAVRQELTALTHASATSSHPARCPANHGDLHMPTKTPDPADDPSGADTGMPIPQGTESPESRVAAEKRLEEADEKRQQMENARGGGNRAERVADESHELKDANRPSLGEKGEPDIHTKQGAVKDSRDRSATEASGVSASAEEGRHTNRTGVDERDRFTGRHGANEQDDTGKPRRAGSSTSSTSGRGAK